MDIVKGHAMTNRYGVVLDIFQFVDRERFLELNASAEANGLVGSRLPRIVI